MNDEKEKEKEYFITRYSLIPDVQIDLESYSGTTKEAKFINWLNSFAQEKKKEIDCNGNLSQREMHIIEAYRFLNDQNRNSFEDLLRGLTTNQQLDSKEK